MKLENTTTKLKTIDISMAKKFIIVIQLLNTQAMFYLVKLNTQAMFYLVKLNTQAMFYLVKLNTQPTFYINCVSEANVKSGIHELSLIYRTISQLGCVFSNVNETNNDDNISYKLTRYMVWVKQYLYTTN
ncbi:hypothetical protein BLOT_011707 [Blomia tropicalis]|nr:hypothetical protein BLOT_011707 [Blomia tropicalis]